jgi:two-component system sensor histidine kinase UhpB
VAITCTAEGDFGGITPDAALCVYRIAQEALRNVIAHARASRADVRLFQLGDQVQIMITDDGRGFDAASRVERDTGLGLVSMSERARLIGGTVSIVSRPNRGTQVEATIPMNVCVKVDAGSRMAGQVA